MTILDRIVATKRAEVARARAERPLDILRAQCDRTPASRNVAAVRDFFGAVTATGPIPQLIAEIKRSSPSAGTIVADFDPVTIAQIYLAHGAAALSVLTDWPYFGGRLEYVEHVRDAVPLPVLRKEFVVDEYQVYESRAAGADAVLLIAEILGIRELALLTATTRDLGMCPLVEVHAEEHLNTVLGELGPPARDSYLLGINNRDLVIQQTDLATTERLSSRLPAGAPFVAESGIGAPDNVRRVQRAGACAMLVGESLLRSPDIGEKVDELRNPARGSGS